MTPRQRNGAPPPDERPVSEDASRHHAAEQPNRNPPGPALVRVVEIDLPDIGWGLHLAGAQVIRVQLGSDPWPSSQALTTLAAVTFEAARVELIGRDSRTVQRTAETLLRLYAQYQRNAGEYDEPTDWPDSAPAGSRATGAQVAKLVGSAARRAEAVSPLRCANPGCNVVLSVPHPLPAVLSDVRCDRHTANGTGPLRDH